MQLLIAVRPGSAAAVARAARWSRRRSRKVTRRLERRPRRPAHPRRRRGRRPHRLVAKLRRRPARGLQGGLRRRHRGPRPHAGSRSCRADDGLAFDLYTPDERRRRRPAAEGVPHRPAPCRWPGRCRSSPRWASRSSTSGPTRSSSPTTRRCGSTTSACGCRPASSSTRCAPRNVIEAVRLLWLDQIEQDGFNALVVRSRMTWWQANILRAYAKYLRQAGTTFSQGYIEQALVEHCADRRRASSSCSSRASTRTARTRRRSSTATTSRRRRRSRRCWPTSPASTRTASCGRCSGW